MADGFHPFPSTDWADLRHGAVAAGAARQGAVERLARRYHRPLRAYLMAQRGLSAAVAEEVLQAFYCEKMLDAGFIARADPARGKFRSFLLASLNHFVVDSHRRRVAGQRKDGDLIAADRLDALAQDAPVCAFELQWARYVLDEVLQRMERACVASGREDIWRIFDARVLSPALDGVEPVAYEQLVAQFGLKSPLQAANVLITAKRMFDRTLREVLTEGLESPSAGQVDSEIRELMAILARRRD